MRQALNYQLEFSRYHPPTAPHIETLLEDYTVSAVPNACRDVFDGHTSNVKLVTFLGDQGKLLASCSSDSTVRVWDVERARCALVLDEHQRRVWSVASGQRSGTVCVTASADATVKIWNVKSALEQREMGDDDEEKEGQGQGQRQRFESVESSATLVGHDGDVYTVAVHPAETHAVTAGYDKVVRLFDMQTGQLVDSFCGHALGVTSVAFNTHGNLVVTGSKDNTVRFWDVVSGVCVRTLDARHGEVTSVATNPANSQLLVATKDNSHRLWDLRMVQNMKERATRLTALRCVLDARCAALSRSCQRVKELCACIVWTDVLNGLQWLRGIPPSPLNHAKVLTTLCFFSLFLSLFVCFFVSFLCFLVSFFACRME